MSEPAPVVIVGGGLAGLASAIALRQQGLEVRLFEARRRLGGRASSFRDPENGELLDFCQHVSMGCCTNLADFCRRAEISDCFDRYQVLHFFSPDGRRYDLAASAWLPAPLHLSPALLRMSYLSLVERARLAWTLWRLARAPADDLADTLPFSAWLSRQRQSERVTELFWNTVLVSALGETLDRVSVSAARKVFVDGFLSAREAFEVLVPAVPLGELYGSRLEARLAELGVQVELEAPVQQVLGDSSAEGVRLADGTVYQASHIVLALTWRQVAQLLPPAMLDRIPQLQLAAKFESAPITGIHLWFDRPIMALPHAVLLGRLSHWVFARGANAAGSEYYYQVVISASRNLPSNKQILLDEIVRELHETFPEARSSRLIRSQVVTEKQAVFSPLPGMQHLRPEQQTPVPNLFLAGDWTRTGWPATMESAVRSGYLAAEALLASSGCNMKILVPDLDRSLLARMFF